MKKERLVTSFSGHRRKPMAVVLAAALLSSGSWAAQLEEIVVTAQKRAENTQDIGIAITALGSDKLIKSDLNNVQDLQNLAPSLQVGETFGFAQLMIRGIGTDNPFAGGDPSVAMHFDGVVTGQSSAQFGSLFDVDRIEVLRGPQGTLYGRNTTGGSVNVITNRPTEELSGYGRVTFGNYELKKFEGAISGPISDQLLGRLAVRTVDRGGYGKNIYNGDDIDDANQLSVRGQLTWLINENMDLRLAVEHHEEDDRNYMPKYRAPSYDPAPIPALMPQPVGGVKASDPRDINANADLQNEREQSSYTAEFNWAINDRFSLTSLTNYQEFEKIPQNDYDMTSEAFYVQSEQFETEQFSEELRVNYDGERVRGLVGVYYYSEDIESDNRLDLALNPGPPRCTVNDNTGDTVLGVDIEDLCFNFAGNTETEAYAIFGNFAFDLTDSLVLNVGARYSYEHREGFTHRWLAAGVINPVTFEDEKSFNELSPSVRLEWNANEDVMLYASYSEGFKSGIMLSGQTSPVLDPEIMEAYEVGMKGMFLDRSLQLNAAAFYYDYTDLQQGRSVPAGTNGFTLIYENAASAEVEGAEVELTWLPTERLRFDASATYLDSVFKEYISTDPFDTVYQLLGLIPAGEDLSQDLGGNRMVQSPKWSWNLAATLDFDLGDSGWLGQGTVSAAYKDDIFFTQFNNEDLGQDSVTTYNANISFTSPDDRWLINLWGKNLSDEEVYSGTFILNSSRLNAGFLAPPRTYGVSVGYNF